ncbi:MAG TPA: hypothetical protein DE313_07165 [Ruminococcus sp.]|nr:hypothetical protein [Ruminococcus sp.]
MIFIFLKNGISKNSVFYDQLPELLLVAVKVEPLISVFQEFHTVPFVGEVYYKEFFDINDFAEYYRDKEIYDVEKLNDTALLITDKSNSYSFTIKLFDEGMFVLGGK